MASLSDTLGTGGLENSAFFSAAASLQVILAAFNLFDAYQVAGRPSGYSTQSAFSQESFEMIYNGSLSSVGRCVASLMIATLVVTTSESPLMAAPAARAPHGILATAGTSDATDFSAARRRRHYRRGGDAAALAFMGLAIGTIAGAIATQRRYDYYDNGYYYGGPYYGGPYYGTPYYGRRFYYRPF